MYVKHKAMLHYQKVVLKNAPQWFLLLFHFLQDFSCCSIIYISSMIFSYLIFSKREKQTNHPHHAQKNKWEMDRDRHSNYLDPRFSETFTFTNFLQNDIPLWISSWDDNIALWIIFMLFLHQWKWYLYVKGPL